MEADKKQQHIILVHGAGHGAWCWYKVAPLLRSAGHRVTAPDLAASGRDATRLEEVATFADYSRPLLEIMAALPRDERVVLVGHSLGGLNIAMAMDRFPDKVALAIFVTALLPDCTNAPVYPLLQFYRKYPSKVPGNRTLASVLFDPQHLASNLYQLSPPEDLMLATTLVRPASAFLEDLGSRPPFSRDRYGSVDSAFVVCSDDLQMPVDFQRWLTHNYQVKEVIDLDGADHMPMMSVPKQLCKSLLDLVHRLS